MTASFANNCEGVCVENRVKRPESTRSTVLLPKFWISIMKISQLLPTKSVLIKWLTVVGMGVFGMNEPLFAQSIRSYFVPYSSVGFGLGTSSYYGDLAPHGRPVASTFKPIRWNVSADYTRHFTPRLGARLNFTWARVLGDDNLLNNSGAAFGNTPYARNLNFRNDIKEFSALGIFKLIPDSRSYDRRPQVSPYLMGGIAVFAHNPRAKVPVEFGDEWVRLQPYGTEGQGNPGYAQPYSLVQFALPLGGGIRYKINKRLDVSAELLFRFTTTDFLDDVAGNYPDPSVLRDDLARALSNRSTEVVAVRRNQDRTEGVARFVRTELGIEPGANPFITLAQNGFGQEGTLRGSSPGRRDSFMTGTIRVHYILGSTIKCPPLK